MKYNARTEKTIMKARKADRTARKARTARIEKRMKVYADREARQADTPTGSYNDGLARSVVLAYRRMLAFPTRSTVMSELTHKTYVTDYERQFTNYLYSLSFRTSFSVVNKLKAVAWSPKIEELYRDMARMKTALDAMQTAQANIYDVSYTKTGKEVRTLNAHSQNVIDTLIHDSMGDGFDVVQTCALSLWEHLKESDHDSIKNCRALEEKHTRTEKKKEVFSQYGDAVEWKERTGTAVQFAHRDARKLIDGSHGTPTRTKEVNGKKYTYENPIQYIADIVANPESGKEEQIYYRLRKHADLGGYTYDYNGAYSCYTTDITSYSAYEAMRTVLDDSLTDRQKKILDLRESGLSVSEICDVLHIKSKGTIAKHMKYIRQHAIECGITPDGVTDTDTLKEVLAKLETERNATA